MADGDRRVLLDEHERGRHADHGGAADDDGVLAGDLDPGAPEDLDGGVGRRRQEPVVAEAQQAGVERVDAVDVLGRIDRVDDGAQSDRRRERHLDDDAVDSRVVVELADRGRHARLGRLAFELDEARVDADRLAAAQDPVEVDRRRRVAPDDDDARPGGRPRFAVNAATSSATARPDLRGDGRALQEPGPGGRASSSRGLRPGSGRAARRCATTSRVSAARRSTSWRSSSTRAVISCSKSGSPDRRQVDEDVGRRAAGCGLAEQRRDVRGRSRR